MITAALFLLVSTPAEAPAPSTAQIAPSIPAVMDAKPSKNTTKSCREMLMSSSRLGKVKVCKTRAEWRRWDDCHRSVTRYCTPKKKEVLVAGMAPNEKLVCKYVAETGTRVGRQRLCATKREWELVELETQDTIRNRQSQSLLEGTQTIFQNPSGIDPQ